VAVATDIAFAPTGSPLATLPAALLLHRRVRASAGSAGEPT
jgi:hypothetical protein